MQHTEPKLTWDADDAGRKRALSRRLNEEEIKDGDFAAYLGSEDEGGGASDEEEDGEALRARYRSA